MIARRRRNRLGASQEKRLPTPNSPAPQVSDSTPPRLIKTGSMSSSSSNESPPRRSLLHGKMMNQTRSSSRGRNRLPFRPHHHQRRPSADPPGSKLNSSSSQRRSHSQQHQNKPMRDSSILKGAEILRRELSDVKKQHTAEAWDPWRIPTEPSGSFPNENNNHHRRHEDISELTVSADDAAYWAARPNVGHGIFEDFVDYEDYGGQVPQSKNMRENEEKKTAEGDIPSPAADDDTMNILEHAMTFLGTKSRSAEVPKTEQIHLHQQQSKNCSAPPSIVQRVSDLEDNKSFASMFASSYLPQQLLPKSFDHRNSQDIKYQHDHKEDELETSTLDYIASMYIQKQDEKASASLRSSNSERNLQNRPRSSTEQTTRSERLLNTARVTDAAAPFERMVAPSSYFFDELVKDPAYQHAANAGMLWQSLCSQHVRFPSLWWDGDEPGSPPLGTPEKQSWRYLGRHRVKADRKLNSLIGNRGSSGRILLHLVVRDDVTCEPVEDICCGCFHPNARGVRTTPEFDPKAEDCRDIWIGHRRRFQSKSLSTLEALLKRYNKSRVFASPLGGPNSSASDIRNGNLKAVFGEKPPLFTVFVTESEIFELIRNESSNGSPVSVVLLRRFLRYRIG